MAVELGPFEDDVSSDLEGLVELSYYSIVGVSLFAVMSVEAGTLSAYSQKGAHCL